VEQDLGDELADFVPLFDARRESLMKWFRGAGDPFRISKPWLDPRNHAMCTAIATPYFI